MKNVWMYFPTRPGRLNGISCFLSLSLSLPVTLSLLSLFLSLCLRLIKDNDSVGYVRARREDPPAPLSLSLSVPVHSQQSWQYQGLFSYIKRKSLAAIYSRYSTKTTKGVALQRLLHNRCFLMRTRRMFKL